MPRVWIRLQEWRAGPRVDFKLIQQTLDEFGNKYLPDSGVCQSPHRVQTTVPVVEVTHNTDARGVRRPNRKCDAFCAAYFGDVRAEFVIDLRMASFAKEMEIDLAKRRRKLLFHLCRG